MKLHILTKPYFDYKGNYICRTYTKFGMFVNWLADNWASILFVITCLFLITSAVICSIHLHK